MSYILDALKKSEQERGHGSVPGVQTVHSSSLNYNQQKRPVWPWFLLVILIINISAIIYFLQSQQSEKAVLIEQQPVDKKTQIIEQQSPEPVIVQPVQPEVPVQQELAQNAEIENDTYMEQSTYETAPVENTPDVVDLYELPLNVRQYIPAMTFSAHVYSSNARQRSLVINDRFMEEGDEISEGLVLTEITRDGAIFNYQGHLFRTSVLSGWRN